MRKRELDTAEATSLEQKYFAEDKDAKKREKLLDSLLKEPGVAKKLGDDWKRKMLEQGATVLLDTTNKYRVVTKPHVDLRYSLTWNPAPQPDRPNPAPTPDPNPSASPNPKAAPLR